jgi:4-amino-4-deoxy-L-arabinose transferase-like glycosyltransferase
MTLFFLAAILLSSCLLSYLVLRTDRFGAYHDDGIYVTTARAIAEGQGYRIISLPGEPHQTKYPPFYPFLLSLIWSVYPAFPQNLTWMMLLSVIATLSFLLVAWRYLVKNDYAGHGEALIVVALTALNWRTMILATSVYSEMLFALLAVAALHLVEKHERDTNPSLTGVLAGTLIGLAFLTRSSGIALVFSAAVYFGIRRQWKRGLLPVALASLFVVGWTTWCYVNKTAAHGVNVPYYTSYVGHLNQVVGDLQALSGSSRLTVLLNMAVQNFVGGILISTPLVSCGLSYNAFAGLSRFLVSAAICAGFLSLVLLTTGFGRSLAKGIRLLHIYILTCLGLYLFWLPDVSYDRFLMPMLPFLLLFLVCELGVLVSLFRKGMQSGNLTGKISGALIALALVLVVGIMLFGYGSGTYSSLSSLGTSSARAADDARAISWINEHTDSSDALVCYRDPKYFLYTGHKAVRSFPMTEGFSWQEDPISMDKLAQAVFRIIDEAGARYLVVTATDFELEDRPEQHRKTFDKLIEEHPRSFASVFESTDGRSRIYRIEAIAR